MIKANKKRSVDLSRLPIYTEGLYKGKVNWKESIGCYVSFVYDDLVGELKIEEYIYPIKKEKAKIKLSYEGNVITKPICTSHFSDANIGGLLKRKTKDFKIDIGTEIKDRRRNFFIIDREYRKNESNSQDMKYYKYKCNKCKNEDWLLESDIINGGGCNTCCLAPKKAVLDINTIWDTDRWMCDLGVSEEDAKGHTHGSNKRINVICPDCGRKNNLRINAIYGSKSISCTCGDGFSYPEKFMANLLTQLNIKFETEYSPDYLIPSEGERCRKFSDFYLPDYKLVVETDGKLGHKDGTTHSKSNKSLGELVAVDKWKDEQHRLNGVKTIRINCFKSDMEYIKNNILNSELANYFDLNNIDWLKCEEFALSNLVKEVCEYWKSKEEWETVSNLILLFCIDRKTVIKYLKKGVNHNWCEYNAKEEINKGVRKLNKNGKPVEIFKDNISLAVFNSCSELERESEYLFGIKLDHRNISAVCNGKKENYKGFTFKYCCMNS